MYQPDNKQKGYTSLILVIIVSAVVLIIAILVSSLSLNETIIGNEDSKSEKALQLADTCSHEAVLRLSREFNGEGGVYAGGTLNIGSDSCTITITPSGSNRVVDVESTLQGNTNKKIQLTIQMSPTFDVLSWQEQQ